MSNWLMILALGVCAPLVTAAETFPVSRFGAVAGDGKEDAGGFRAALGACVQSPGSTLVLEPGRYDLALRSTPPDGSSPPVLVVTDARGLTIDGRGAEIVCHDFATLFQFENCRDVTIRNLKIDYDPLPFTAGQIIAEGDGYVDIRIEKHHPVQAGFLAESLLPYDPQRHRMGLAKKDDLYQPGYDRRTQKIGPDLLRVPVKRKLYKTGDWVILRHQIYSKNAFDFQNCQSVSLQDVTVYTCPGMALHANGGADFSLEKFDVTIKPGTGRWFTATADATHFNGTRGKVVLDNCLLEAMGDDGANIHNWYLVVTAAVDAKTFKCVLGKDPHWDPPVPRPDDVLEIGRMPNPLVARMTCKVASAKLDETGKTVIVTLQSPPAEAILPGDVVGNDSALPVAEVRHCTIRRNRARGVLIQTRHAIVQDCTFQDISGAAIQVTSDVQRWWEGMPARDVTIRSNTISRVNFGIASRAAALDIFADVGRAPAPEPVHQRIDIEGNTFSEITGSMIHVGSAEHVTIHDNTFVHPTPPVVTIDHSRDVKVSGNSGCADEQRD
jgi:hypothetical protein